MQLMIAVNLVVGLVSVSVGALPTFFEEYCDSSVLPGREFVLSASIHGLTTGDVDGDGRDEVILGVLRTGSGTQSGVVVAFTNPQGRTPTEVFTPMGLQPTQLITADLDRDGVLDLVAGRHKGGLAMLLGTGTGAFLPMILDEGYGYLDFDVADLDDDGYADIVATSALSDRLYVHFNNGQEGFLPRVSFQFPYSLDAIKVADMDGDGDDDIVVSCTNEPKTLVVFNTGARELATFLEINVRTSEIARMDADGLPDVITLHTGAVRILRNVGDGTFLEIAAFPMTDSPNRIRACDVDADGLSDLVMTWDYPGQAVVFRNTGDGVLEVLEDTPVSRWLREVAFGDTDGKNGPDLVTAGDRGHWGILHNDGQGRYRPHTSTLLNNIACDTIHPLDVNHDAWMDFACIGRRVGAIVILENRQDGTFERRVTSSIGDDVVSGLNSFDIDDDGDEDILVATRNTLTVFTNDGVGGYTRAAVYPLTSSPNISRGGDISVGDLDDDGDLDVVVANGGISTIHVFRNDGAGALIGPTSQYVGSSLINAALVDVNGDAHLDIVCLGTSEPQIQILDNPGTGVFTTPRTAVNRVATSPRDMAVADMDGNGTSDVIVLTLNDAWVLPNDHSGAFAIGSSIPTGSYSDGIALGDVNGDAKVDILSMQSSQNEVTVSLNRGHLDWCNPVGYIAGIWPIAAAVADIDSDGRSEVCVCSYSECRVNTLRPTAGLVRPLCPADIDGDAFATAHDFVILALHFGASVPPGTSGDLNNDGLVNSADFVIFAAAFGAECP